MFTVHRTPLHSTKAVLILQLAKRELKLEKSCTIAEQHFSSHTERTSERELQLPRQEKRVRAHTQLNSGKWEIEARDSKTHIKTRAASLRLITKD